MTSIPQPMLAVPRDKVRVDDWNDWAIEQKYDGHRLIIKVGAMIEAWTRPRKHAGGDKKTMMRRDLPAHLLEQLAKLPTGIYDGELLAVLPDGKFGTATDVTRKDLAHRLAFVVFDVLSLKFESFTLRTYDERRTALEGIDALDGRLSHVALAPSQRVTCLDDVTAFVEAVWRTGGEGAIIKRRAAVYQCGKRSKDMVKIKRSDNAVLKLVGFEPTQGKVLRRGIFAVMVGEDENGQRVTCKTPDDAQIREFEQQWESMLKTDAKLRAEVLAGGDRASLKLACERHPALGRLFRIEFPFRTRTGGYQGPIIFDRWEDE